MKRRETDPASNQFPECSPPSGTHRDSQSWVEKRRGREETEATWWRKRRVQSIKEIEKASDIGIRRGQKEYPPAMWSHGVGHAEVMQQQQQQC